MAMRVTDSALYRKYTTSVNDVHAQFNKSMNKISSGAAYESAAENPLAYYAGKRMDNQYQDTLSKKDLLTDIQNRLHQQELGVRSIQGTLASGTTGSTVRSQLTYILNTTNNEIATNIDTVRSDLEQKIQSMVSDLNAQYENFFIYGGNDLSTTPFALDMLQEDKIVLTYNHTFPGEDSVTSFKFNLEKGADGNFSFKLAEGDWGELQKAMSEQGRVDVGYGYIHDKNTLIDTYTGGLNVLTGITSDVMKSAGGAYSQADFEKALSDSAIGLTGQSILTMKQYANYLNNDRTTGANAIDKAEFSEKLGAVLDQVADTSNELGSVYSSLGNRYNNLTTTLDRLEQQKITLETQYKEKLGADPYEAIIEMYSTQRTYQASLMVSANIMNMSLFNYMGS